MSASPLSIAVGPRPAGWAAEAIRRGGGEPVTLDQHPVGLVWTDGSAMEPLRRALAPWIAWVQLPQAGIERVFEAGVIDHERRWTSARGAGNNGPVSTATASSSLNAGGTMVG